MRGLLRRLESYFVREKQAVAGVESARSAIEFVSSNVQISLTELVPRRVAYR